jgi:UDP-N-acetyl-D-glucosamine dehydrogenase
VRIPDGWGSPDRPLVCIQGIGFVGTAMALAVSAARDAHGRPAFDVVGVEIDNETGRERAAALAGGRVPVDSADPRMAAALESGLAEGNLTATTEPTVYERASVTVVDIGLDLGRTPDGEPDVDFGPLRAAARGLGERMPEGSLVVVETTVPPGTCEKVIAPEIEAALEARGLPRDAIMLAHAYERVMPGDKYLDSIVNFWRVYAGSTAAAADACEAFLSAVVNVDEFPLTRLPSTTASEIGKLLENSYRATTIAFMEEWGRFAEAIDVDLFQVISAIRRRPTHSNMRQPGFGVGGYCLTKDPLFAQFGAHELFGLTDLEFPFSARSVEINEAMPLVTLERLQELLGGSLEGRRILLLGVAYRQGVADTRFSPSGVFRDAAVERGAEVVAHDPLLTSWDGRGDLPAELPAPDGFDAVVLAVAHPEYSGLDVAGWLGDARPLVVDANAVLSGDQLAALAQAGSPVWSIGRGRVAG